MKLEKERNILKFSKPGECIINHSHTSSVTLGSAPAFNKQLIISELPISAAMCKGVAPPALTFTLAPACVKEYVKVSDD